MLTEKTKFAIFLLILTSIEALITLLPARLAITGHEGDMLHMLDMGLRMADGELPHLDFMTPIGILGIAPVALFLSQGFAVAKSGMLADLLVCVALLPAIWWVGVTRLSGVTRWFFGGFLVVLVMAVVFGGVLPSVSLSLYYNRWAWAISFIMLITVLFPAHNPLAEKWIPPLIVGAALSALAMIKMTYFISFLPAVIILLLAQKKHRMLFGSLIVGLVIAAGLVLMLGIDFVLAYKDDLLALATGDVIRSHPGEDLIGVLTSPGTIQATLVLLGAIMALRSAGRAEQGLALLVLAPAFIYITYQNWGNDPKWLLFVIIYLAANLPEVGRKMVFRLPARQASVVLIIVGIMLVQPMVYNLVSSPIRAAFTGSEGRTLVPLRGGVSDILVSDVKVYGTIATREIPGITPYSEEGAFSPEINGIPLPACESEAGFINFTIQMSEQLNRLPETIGKQILLADNLNALWLLGTQERVRGAAPWYYDDDSGFEFAEYFVVPNCPIKLGSRATMVANMNATGWQLERRFVSSLMSVYKINKPD